MKEINLADDIENLFGVGKYYKDRLKKLDISTIKDFLWHFPFRYEDFSNIRQIAEINSDQPFTVVGKISNIKSYRTYHKRMLLTNAKIEDDSGSAELVWFNQPFISKQLKNGMTLSISGKPKVKGKSFIFQAPSFEIVSQADEEADFSEFKHTGRLIPVYPETSKVTSKMIRTYTKKLLEALSSQLHEYLPEETLARNNLFVLEDALNKIHFPSDLKEAAEAKKRFIFEEMLLVQLHLMRIKDKMSKNKAPKIKSDIALIKDFLDTLPFILTKAQKKAI